LSVYLPAHFEERRIEVLHALIREEPLGTLVTAGPEGITANHVPFEIDPEPAPFGTLRAHVARANPVWRDHPPGAEALVIFQGASTYVSPSWYPSKRETGKVVPTYNYVVVHARGRLRAIDDPAWLRRLVGRLTDRHEAGSEHPWKVTDAPGDYVESQLRAIVGIEIVPGSLVGKWKLSQNRPPLDRDGVVRALERAGDARSLDMAKRVKDAPPPRGR
jgi:transcriptional regulator